MLVNEKFFKKLIFFLLLFLWPTQLYADNKSKIISQLNNLKSLEFTFDQIVNEKTEKGNCLLQFPGKLKCNYFDEKEKELIINNKKMAITQKRYDKTYHYHVSKSPFLNILYKNELIKIIESGKLELSNNIIELIYDEDNKITVFFDQRNFELKGWKIIDQYNNKINFSLNIISKNDIFNESIFKVPEIN